MHSKMESDEELVQEILVKESDIDIIEPFQGAVPPAKRFKSNISLCDDNISIPSPFDSTSSIRSSTSSTNNSSTSSPQEVSEDDSDCVIESINIDEPYQFDDENAFDLSGDVSGLLYDSSTVSVSQSLALLFTWFCSSPGISKESFSKLLHLISSFLLPPGNKLPNSYKKARASIKDVLVPIENFDCCVNDCIVYRNTSKGDFKSLSTCPQCNTPRYFPNTTNPKKSFKYIPLAPRLKRMFANKKISQLLQSHLKNDAEPKKKQSLVCDLHQSNAWKSLYDVHGPFQGDSRGISFSLCTDGTNPFSKEKIQYSMWPIMLSLLNLPQNLRNVRGSILLAGIIPGKLEPKSLDPYIEILVDEITSLNGSSCYDAYRNEEFKMKLNILIHVLDYPGQNKLFHCAGANAYAGCAYCTHVGEYSNTLQKMIYPRNRCFLKDEDDLRQDSKNFPLKKAECSGPPMMKTMEYVDDANMEYSAAESNAEKKELFQKTGCKGSCILRKLYLHERILNTPVEPMHLIKNIVAHSVNLIAGHEDSHKVREEERKLHRFPSSWIKDKSQKRLPDAPFSLSKQEIALADERARRVLVPSGFDWTPKPIFSKTAGLKSHEWKQLASSGILKFCLRGMLGRNQRKTLYRLFDVIHCICDEAIDNDTIDVLEQEVHTVLSLMERDFPVSMQVIVFHLLHHLPFYLKRFGPARSFWMYHYERFNSWIIRRCLNRRHPESTVIETYRLTEWAYYLEMSGQLCNGAIELCQNDKEDDHEGNPVIEESSSQMLLTDEQLKQVKEYYLSQNPELRKLTDQYNRELAQAKTYHRLKAFPSISEWTPKNTPLLSDYQREICRGPAFDAIMLKHITYKDQYNRPITITCMESDCEHSYRRCSYVSSTNASSVVIGRIVMLFDHTFLSNTTTFADVSWFDNVYSDSDSGLYYVLAREQSQSVVPITSISQPLVVAYDDEESDKLWIISITTKK